MSFWCILHLLMLYGFCSLWNALRWLINNLFFIWSQVECFINDNHSISFFLYIWIGFICHSNLHAADKHVYVQLKFLHLFQYFCKSIVLSYHNLYFQLKKKQHIIILHLRCVYRLNLTVHHLFRHLFTYKL